MKVDGKYHIIVNPDKQELKMTKEVEPEVVEDVIVVKYESQFKGYIHYKNVIKFIKEVLKTLGHKVE